MTREYKKLNSTGSLLKHIPTNTIYSYRTPIYEEFFTCKGLLKPIDIEKFKDTYNISEYKTQANIVFHHCPYGNWSLDTAFKNEISMTKYELEKLQNKTRKLGKRQAEQLENLKTRLTELQNLYEEI